MHDKENTLTGKRLAEEQVGRFTRHSSEKRKHLRKRRDESNGRGGYSFSQGELSLRPGE